ncbi:MAG: hypothetical protein US83_C0020G0009 [Candidatus Falkowbacteria bacterium GW2011_GWC2_38_22]|nr:MAG: hypothetical protein US83_C0020G0009 [Candidatus Falkowbacteria bacterium GW2011_GWC2_38_22]KKQ62368.1 MAG: hypothetical protein US84_C0018G0002 [Candidatus Falkowbacteria bacterium GW2011_GWF1_38_22]KKQ71574.1 MAG: hypothetical protein US93_C0017G0002 [Candidatus Falkowbacteria bacterium GW2011_GWD2_38_42]HAM88875.1 hypothetical protein [Candidatus Falkowbacteria bacterium]HAY12676.1 hypothetical protein [Candidatus Falkowbacteria bacterium]
MVLLKQTKDYLIKFLWNGKSVPIGLFELAQYFRTNGAIHFEFKQEGKELIAISKNFQYGTIVTSAESQTELDEKIKDAILTAFDVPSSYAKEAGVHKVEQRVEQKVCAYAFA